MTASKAQIAANQRYREKYLERFEINVKKGKKAEYKQAAAARGIGLMELARRGIEEYIQNHPVDEEKSQ